MTSLSGKLEEYRSDDTGEFYRGWNAALNAIAKVINNGGTVTTYTADQIRDAIAKSKTIDELASALEIQYQPAPQADFASFTAKDLENYLQTEVAGEDEYIEWDELRGQLEDGGYTPWRGERVDFKPFPHGVVRVEDDEETGGEGSQESIYIVLSVTAHVVEDGIGAERKRYFRKEGYYASYDGSSWDGDFHEVWPKQKEITVWVSKKP